MTREILINTIKKHRGPIYVALSTAHSVHHVQAVKSDLVAYLGTAVEDGELQALVSGGALYIDA